MPISNIYPETRFVGTLEDQRGRRLHVGFIAFIDNAGELHVRIDPLSEGGASVEFVDHSFGRDGQTFDLKLTGTEPAGTFASADFYITGKRIDGPASNTTLTLAGRCGSALITRRRDHASPQPAAVAFYTNGFKALRQLRVEHGCETVILKGHMLWDQHDPPTAGELVLIDASGTPPEDWYKEAKASLQHVARVMSLALDVYVTPRVVYERRSDIDIFSVDGGISSPHPYIAPFHSVHLDGIFKHAVFMTDEQRNRFEAFDLPIRWLIAPAHYNEARHIGAMTALEAILSNADTKGGTLLDRTQFDRLKKKIADMICEDVGDLEISKLMCNKLQELNRLTLFDKLGSYLSQHDVPISDFDPEILRSVITARNQVVHRGVGKDKHADIGPFMYVARALVTRMILRAAKYRGPLRWMDGEIFREVEI